MKMALLLLVSTVALSFFGGSCAVAAAACTPEDCKLPDCLCTGTAIPGGLAPKQVPQIVMLTFGDAVTSRVWPYYKELLPSIHNPNGCPMSATFFVSHNYSNYYYVQHLHHLRQEIADHSITHRTPSTWWAKANATQWKEEMGGMRTILNKFANIPKASVGGVRAPFLQPGGDVEFEVIHSLGFKYESSMPTLQIHPPMWPYTLDYPTTQECTQAPCPKGTYPGFWEVPLVDLVDKHGKPYAMVDGFVPTSEDDAYEFLESNFQRHYESNRAPFGIFMDAAWFPAHPNMAFPALKRLLTKLESMNDTWIVSVSQTIEWIRHPHPLDAIKDFMPWQCTSPAPPEMCEEAAANNCRYNIQGRLVSVEKGSPADLQNVAAGSPLEEIYMVTCAPCPPHYPTVGNPTGQ